MKIILQIKIVIFLFISINLNAQNWNEITKTLPPDYYGNDNNGFGWSVAIDGNYAVVGAIGDNDNIGKAYVLFYDNTNWVKQAELTASDGDVLDYFGYSVGISGDYIVIGSSRDDDNGSNSGSVYVYTKPGTGWASTSIETAKLTPSDGAVDDYFGYSVGISGNNIVVGAYQDDDNGSSSGSAYVFTKSGASWVTTTTETAKLTPSDGAADDYFGFSVGISSNTIVVGAYQDDDNGSNSGSVYVYENPGSGWVTTTSQTAKLTSNDAAVNDFFGKAVGISGDNIIVGAQGNADNGSNSGSAYVYSKPGTGWVDTSSETAKLTPSDGAAGDLFGSSVDISGNYILVGARGDSNNGFYSGSAYVYTNPGTGWVTTTNETAKLSPSDGAADDNFSYSLGISGDNVLVGAYGDGDGGPGSGAVYGFIKPSSGWVDAAENHKNLPTPYIIGLQGQYYGNSVAVDGNYAVVGSYGHTANTGKAYVLFYNGTSWVTQAELTTSDVFIGQLFGYSVGISGDNIVVGAIGDDDNGSASGSVYVYTKPGTGWVNSTETAKLTTSDGAAGDQFGYSVGISGDNIVVGAIGDSDNGNGSGSVYVYTKTGASWVTTTETAKLISSDGAANDRFGISVDVSGDNIVVGAYGDGDNGSYSGSVYVYTEPGTGWITSTETAKLTPSDGAAADYFGFSVGISGDNIVVGAYQDDDFGSNSGSAYVYTKPGTGWVSTAIETAKLTKSGGAADDNFGYSVGISGDNILVGAYGNDDNGLYTGSAYVYAKPTSGWASTSSETAELFSNDGAQNYFGFSVGISGFNIVVGASYDSDQGNGAGAAYFYRPVCAPTTSSFSITECVNYTVPSGDETYTTPGTVTVMDTIVNSCGADSVLTINLTILPPKTGTVNTTICATGSVVINGTTYDAATPNGTEVFTNVGPNMCDSIVTVALNVEPAIDVTIDNTLMPNLTVNQSGATYQWVDCDNGNAPIPSETGQSFTATVNGNYAVEVTVGSCTELSSCEAITGVGIKEVTSNVISIYPNPTRGLFTISLANTKKAVSYTITTLEGRLVEQENNVAQGSIQVDLMNESKGVYLLRISDDVSNKVYKVIRQ